MRDNAPADRGEPDCTLRPPLEEIARGSPSLEDELLAERIEVAGSAWIEGGRVPSLSELLSSVPVLRSRPIALDAAIDIALRGLLDRGFSLETASERLREDAPEFDDAIDAHLALRSLLGRSRPTQPPAPQATPHLPAPFGPRSDDGRQRYELVEFVGRGSEGRVFRAFDRRLSADGRPLAVAIKILHGAAHVAERQVAQEAGRAMRIRHPAIAALLDCGVTDDGAFLTYEFANGASLERWRRLRKALPPREAAEIVRKLAEAVQVAHNAGVVHRDLKPTNVLVDERGSPRITDFGLAAALTTKSEAAAPGGSLGFAAPEQLLGERGAADASVDVYALGGILFWLLTGRFPNGDSAKEVYANLASRCFPGSAEPRGLSRSETTLASICSKALAPDPADRCSSAGVLADDLARWLAWEPVLPFDRSPSRRVALAVRRSPAAAGVVGLALLAICVATGIVWKLDAHRRQAVLTLERERLQRDMAASKARLDNQHRQLETAEMYTHGFIRVLKETNADSGDAAWIPILSALEIITGNEMLGVPDVNGDISAMRLVVVTNVLNQATADGTRDTIEMTLWETARGYWLLHGEQDQEARTVLAENVARVGRLLPPTDPWNSISRALYSIARIRVADDPAGAAEAREWLETNASALPEPLRKFVNAKTDVEVPDPPSLPPRLDPRLLEQLSSDEQARAESPEPSEAGH